MKVLHLIQKPQLRGAEVFASQLATHLIQGGHEAILVCVFAGTAALPFSGKIYHLNANKNGRFTDVKAWKKLAVIIKKEQPDIVQANAGDTLKYAVFSKLMFRWKEPIVFRNASIISLYIKSKFIRLFNAFLFSKTKAVISVSNSSATDFAKLFPKSKNNILTIPVGIEMNAAIQAQNDSNSILPGNPVLVHVGGFSFEKNHAGLISIFEQIIIKYPTAVLHLVGDGPLRQSTQVLVQQKQLDKQVVFHGFKEQPLPNIRQADVLLLPSIIEGLPGVVLEAFYCKTPVVAYDTGGMGEVVIHNQTGLLIPLQQEADFADAVLNLLPNKERINQLTATAYSLVTAQYLNHDIAVRFVKAYEVIAGSREKEKLVTSKATQKVIENDCV